MKPKTDYIILNGSDATEGDDETIQFVIQPHMFRNYVENCDMTIKLVSYTFEHDNFTVPIIPSHTHVKCNIGNNNIYDSSVGVFMASQRFISTLIGGDYWLSSGGMNYSSKIHCAPFSDINFGVYVGSAILDLTAGEITDVQFVLEVEYNY
jgi:hypothetical protein